MRIAVDHQFEVALDDVAANVTLALRVTPEDDHDQTVSGWRIGPDRDVRLRHGRDGFGNVLTMLYVDAPADRIGIHVSGEIFTGPTSGVLSMDHPEPLPPSLFLRSMPVSDRVEDIVEPLRAQCDPIDRLHLLNVALHRDHKEQPTADLATMFVGGARSFGVPARFASGYFANGAGGAVPHVWAEAFVATVGWIGFDPTTGLSAGEGHARAASAIDLAGVAAVRGGRPA